MQRPERAVLGAGRGQIVNNTAEIRNPGREQEMLRSDDRQRNEAQSQHHFLRPFSEQKQQEQRPADGELDALPVEKNPIILFSGIPAKNDTLPSAAERIELDRRSGVAWRLQKAVDSLKILRNGNIGENARTQPGAQQES